MLKARGTLEARELLGVRQMYQGALALRRREPGPLREQQHLVALGNCRSQLAQQRNLLVARVGATADESVAGALPDDVEARIPEQLALHHMPEAPCLRVGSEHGRQEAVECAGVPAEQKQRPAAHCILTRHFHAHA
jgi:hypothetical protein